MITRAISRSLAPTALAASLLVASWAASGTHVGAQATDFTVLAGWEDLDSSIEVQAFLPENMIIAEGDTVTWKFAPDEAHTVTFLGEQEPPELIVALPDGAVIFSPDAALPRGGVQHDGETLLNSGMLTYDPSAGDEPTYSVEFTTAGNYSYICLFHPNMAGTVTVLEERSALPFDQDTYDVIAVRERRTFIAELEALRDARGPLQLVEKSNGTIEHRLLAGLSTTKADYMKFFDDVVDIFVGDSVTWSWGRSQAPHTVSFLQERMQAPGLILSEPEDAKPLPPTLNPLVFNPSGGDTLPAEGFVSSGFRLNPSLDPDTAGPYSLTFTEPGVYDYVCLLHPAHDHSGRIIVLTPPEGPSPSADDTFGPSVGLPRVGGPTVLPQLGVLAGLIGIGLTLAGGYLMRRSAAR